MARAQETTPIPNGVVYTVTYGDSLVRIAQLYGVTWQDIAAANGLTNINRVVVGQQLIIPFTPVPGSTPMITAAPTATLTPLPTTTSTATATLSPTPSPTASASLAPTETVPPAAVSGSLEIVPTPTVAGDAASTAESAAVGGAVLIPLSTIVLATEIPPTLTPSITPTPSPIPPGALNGLAYDQFFVTDEAVQAQVRAIFARGQTLARNPNAFSKLGDSTIENPFFLARFDTGTYNLADYGYLQRVIDRYRGSFGRDSVAVRVGLHSWSVLDPMWADPYQCQSGESLLACEIRQHNPSILFVRLGSNDSGVPNLVDSSLREIVEFCILNGIIPILGTKADRFEGPSNRTNEIIRQIARDYAIPLWDFDLLAGTIPGRGLISDGVHMSAFPAHDWTLPQGFTTGHGVHSLAALIALDQLNRILDSPA
ncbi:MAG: LysM peptidoglycan-binding domain-containing protein [bacterium]|nr:LysM peptidoglycan-binding domain-containing protein [bacterium]